MGFVITSLVIALIIFQVFILKTKNAKNDKVLLTVAFVALVLILGFRNGEINYGSDLNNYFRLYQRAINYSIDDYLDSSAFEFGYTWLNYFLAGFIPWEQFIIIFQAIVCYGFTFRYIYMHSRDTLLALLGFMSMGLFLFYLTGFRQAFAITICLLALEYAEKNKWIKAIIFVIFAATIHKTAILFLPALFLLNIRVNKFTVLTDIILCIILYSLTPFFFSLGNDFFNKSYELMTYGNEWGGIINIVINVVILLFLYFYRYKYLSVATISTDSDSRLSIKDKSVYLEYFHILFVGNMLYAMRYQATTIERVSFYYLPVAFILIPQVIDNYFKGESRRLIRFIVVLCMVFLIYWRMNHLEYIVF